MFFAGSKNICKRRISPIYRTCYLLYCSHKPRKKGMMVMAMVEIRNVRGHIQVYDRNGKFLFSADNEREAREELEYYAESAA